MAKRFVPNMRRVHAAARKAGIPPSRVTLSKKPQHKLQVVLPTGRVVHIGHSGYSDYTIHRDEDRRRNYLKRSKGMPHPKWSRNWLARKLLW